MHRQPRAASAAVSRLVACRVVLGATLLAACARGQKGETSEMSQADQGNQGNQGNQAAQAAQPNALTAAEQAAGWRLLFDGRTLAGWRGYRATSAPAGWQVLDGSLVRVSEGGDLVTEEEFGNFELAVDWKVAPAGNSGIFYRATEDAPRIYESALEMQVLDDAGHVDGKSPLTSAGALYAMYPAPRGVVKPAGEWNQARVIANGAHVEHWLNGTKTAEAEIGSADWNAKVAASKFAEWPGFAKAQRGRIGLQDHGDRVEFRNIRIRVLP